MPKREKTSQEATSALQVLDDAAVDEQLVAGDVVGRRREGDHAGNLLRLAQAPGRGPEPVDQLRRERRVVEP